MWYGLNHNATKASFIRPTRDSFDIANVAWIVRLGVSNDGSKPTAHGDIKKAEFLPLSIAGFFGTRRANRLRISFLMPHWP